MNIQLKKLSINNFKGIRNLEIDFNHTTDISGKNEAGKSSIADAYFWLLWGKNSGDVKDFNIKNTKDLSLNELEHEVTGVLDVDGSEVILKRIYKEKWTNKRGSAVAEFTGHETLYFYNDVPCSQNEYNTKVNAILNEGIAKLITNPFAFNSLKWEQRREVLVKIAGNITDSDVWNSTFSNENSTAMEMLLAVTNAGKSLSEFKREISAKKKKIRETLDLIPARIDEAGRNKPESLDFDFIEKSIDNKRKLISKIDEAISDKVKAHREESLKVIQNQNELNRLKMELQNLEADAKRESQKEINTIESRIGVLEFAIKKDTGSIQTCNTEIASLKSKIESLNIENIKLRQDWEDKNSETIPPMAEGATTCPTCSQSLPVDKIEIITTDYEKNYNHEKKKKLAAINERGSSNGELIERYQRDIVEYGASLDDLKSGTEKSNAELEVLKESLKRIFSDGVTQNTDTPEITLLKGKIYAFQTIPAPVIDDAELKTRKQALQLEVNELVKQFTAKETIGRTDTRIKELETQERQVAQEIADLERTEFTIDAFSKAKMDLVEQRVNSMFSLVKFRMFETQINGGISEACTCLVNGVPFSDANNAGKINAGCDIINTLSGFYNVYAPVWIDNAEAVNEVFPIASQLIKLIVTTEPLKIN